MSTMSIECIEDFTDIQYSKIKMGLTRYLRYWRTTTIAERLYPGIVLLYNYIIIIQSLSALTIMTGTSFLRHSQNHSLVSEISTAQSHYHSLFSSTLVMQHCGQLRTSNPFTHWPQRSIVFRDVGSFMCLSVVVSVHRTSVYSPIRTVCVVPVVSGNRTRIVCAEASVLTTTTTASTYLSGSNSWPTAQQFSTLPLNQVGPPPSPFPLLPSKG